MPRKAKPSKAPSPRKPPRSRTLLLVVGLGNPGRRFEGTRHNVGFDVVRRVASARHLNMRKRLFRQYVWSGRGELVVALPLTYMNRSGEVIPGLLRAAGASADDLLVVCDNMDLEPGMVRIKRRGSSRSHNGLASIMDALGTGDFARLYVGVGHPGAAEAVIDHVLSTPEEAEAPLYEEAAATAARTVLDVAERGLDAAMNDLHRRR